MITESEASSGKSRDSAHREEQATSHEKDSKAVKAGRAGGSKGGAARAAKLSPRKRKQIAKKAALARWQRTR